MLRTSITLPPNLHQKVLLSAKAQGKSMVQVIRELLAESLVKKENANVKQAYKAIDKIVGVCKDDATDTASSINKTLYGKVSTTK